MALNTLQAEMGEVKAKAASSNAAAGPQPGALGGSAASRLSQLGSHDENCPLAHDGEEGKEIQEKEARFRVGRQTAVRPRTKKIPCIGSGAKGTMLQERLRMSMVQHPADYVQTIQTLGP